MSSTTVQIAHSSSMGIYVPPQQYAMWEHVPKGNSSSATAASSIIKCEHSSQQPVGLSDNDQDSSRLAEKMQRRLAQNREAARKSRLRKKAYVQELEVSRLKLAQLELELERAKSNRGSYIGSTLHTNLGQVGNTDAEIAAFEMEYAHWSEEQKRQNYELRIALQANVSDVELHILVEGYLNHFYSLFQMKADVTKLDVFYLISGTWRTSVEQFFLWIGGFRPSELLNVIIPQLEELTDQQVANISKLKHSAEQAEYALSQGLEKLQEMLGQIMLASGSSHEMYQKQMNMAMEKLEAMEGFVSQADHLRKQSLQLMSRILTTSQAARGLLAMGDYFQRLCALSSLWAARPRDIAT